MTSPEPGIGEDTTAKARIRGAALTLFAEYGEDGTSMRAIAAAAGVNVGLLVHYFKTKDGIRDAVEELVVEYHRQAIASVDVDDPQTDVAAARDAAVAAMLADNPQVVNYMRRAILDPGGAKGQMLQRLTDLSLSEITNLRAAGVASSRPTEADQTIRLMVRQLGQLFLQPMVDAMWAQLAGPNASADEKPILAVTVSDGGK